jgi:dTDP-4-amino-4,6-dideoxygalactose transaminase
MPVHLYGRIAVTSQVSELCHRHNLLVLEDAAQAHGASSEGVRAGKLGHAAAFSFYPTKNLGALGDAGAVVTDDSVLAERVRALGNYGSQKRYIHEWQGTNSRLSEIQAAVLSIKLRRLDADNSARRDIAYRYINNLSNRYVVAPTAPPDALAHVWHLFVVRTPARQALSAHLRQSGIETLVHYPLIIPKQAPFRSKDETWPIAASLQEEILSLPIYPTMSEETADAVIAAINTWNP